MISSASTTIVDCWREKKIKNNLIDVQNKKSSLRRELLWLAPGAIFWLVEKLKLISISLNIFIYKCICVVNVLSFLDPYALKSNCVCDCFYWNACDVVGHAIFASIRLYASIHGLPRAARRASCGQSESNRSVSKVIKNNKKKGKN